MTEAEGKEHQLFGCVMNCISVFFLLLSFAALFSLVLLSTCFLLEIFNLFDTGYFSFLLHVFFCGIKYDYSLNGLSWSLLYRPFFYCFHASRYWFTPPVGDHYET